MNTTDRVESWNVKKMTANLSAGAALTPMPVLKVGSGAAVLRGRWLRLAVIQDEDWTAGVVDRPEQWIEELKNWRVADQSVDIFAFSQKLPDVERKYRYHSEQVSLAAIRVTSFEGWWAGLPQETRKNVRRSQRCGVAVKIRDLDDDLVKGIQAVNEECPVVQGKRARHYGRGFEETWSDQSSFLDRSSFICAYQGHELIGYLKLVRCGSTASVLGFLTKPSQQDKRPANALIARAVQLCADEGIPFLIYGMLNYGNKRDGSLRQFKLRNGFHEVLIPRYYVPLTMMGALAVRLRLHRGLLGILPPWVISLALAFRARLREAV